MKSLFEVNREKYEENINQLLNIIQRDNTNQFNLWLTHLRNDIQKNMNPLLEKKRSKSNGGNE